MLDAFKRRYLFALISLLFLPFSYLQLKAQDPLSLRECVEIALQSNKDIQAAWHQQQKYVYEMKALRANFYPSISASFTGLYSSLEKSRTFNVSTPAGQFIADRLQQRMPWLITPEWRNQIASSLAAELAPLNPTIDYRVGTVLVGNVNLTQPIFMGGKIMTGYEMGKLGVRMAELGEKLTREETIVAVQEAYLLMAKAKELQKVAIQYDSLLVQLSHDVESAKRHGMASGNDLMKVQVKKTDARLKVTQAFNGVRLARMNLCQVMVLDLDEPIDIEENTLEETDYLADPFATTADRTEARLLEMKTRLAEHQVKLERAAMLPEIGVSLNGTLLDGMHLMGEKLLDQDLVLNAAISVKIPIFSGGKTRNKILAAKEELARQQLEEKSLREKMNLDLRKRADELEEAGLDLQMKRQNLLQSEENLRISRKAYEVGNQTLSDLLTAQLLWQQGFADFVEAKFEQNIKYVMWQKAAGKIVY